MSLFPTLAWMISLSHIHVREAGTHPHPAACHCPLGLCAWSSASRAASCNVTPPNALALINCSCFLRLQVKAELVALAPVRLTPLPPKVEEVFAWQAHLGARFEKTLSPAGSSFLDCAVYLFIQLEI